MLRPNENNVILDLCSALGSKAMHISELTNRKCIVLGIDISHSRLMNEKLLITKYSYDNINLICAYVSKIIINRKFKKIILDPDCMSIGKIGHSSEVRLWFKQHYIKEKEMTKYQHKLLKKQLNYLVEMAY